MMGKTSAVFDTGRCFCRTDVDLPGSQQSFRHSQAHSRTIVRRQAGIRNPDVRRPLIRRVHKKRSGRHRRRFFLRESSVKRLIVKTTSGVARFIDKKMGP